MSKNNTMKNRITVRPASLLYSETKRATFEKASLSQPFPSRVEETMARSDENVERGLVRNEDIALPPSLVRFLDERSAALEEERVQPLPGEPPVESAEDAEKRAEINRRILEKLGILSEIEELQELYAQRSRPSESA